MSRFYGILVLAALAALAVGLRERSASRSERIFSGEAMAAKRVLELAEIFQREIHEDDSPSTRLAVLTSQHGLRPIPDTGDDRTVFAEGESYVYGLGLTMPVDPRTGRPRAGWVLRAWPRVFGVTGDLEFHIDHLGALWHGQNQVGRSGVMEGFPPQFPAKEIAKPDQPIWWRPDR